MCFLFFLFSKQVQREDRQGNRINGGKENRGDKFGRRHRGEDKQNQWEKKSPMWQGSPHSNVAMCVTNSETKQKPSDHLIPRTGKILPSPWFGRVLAYSIQFQWEALCILCKEQIVLFHLKYTRGTDLMSSVKLRHYHQPLVKGFHDAWACDHSVGFVLCVRTMCRSMGQQTDKASAITGYFLHLVLPSSPLQVHALSAVSHPVPDWFLWSLRYSTLLGSFLTHPNAKPFFLLSSHPASTNFVLNVFGFVLI